MQYTAKTTALVEVCGYEAEIDVAIHFNMTPFTPAKLYPPDKAHPAEGGEIEDVEVEILGKPLDVVESIKEAVTEAAENGHFHDAINDSLDHEHSKYEAARENYEDWKRELREEQAFG